LAHLDPSSEVYQNPAARRKRRLILSACMMAQFMAAVEGTIVGTAMPTIVADLGGFQLFSWVFASYLLAQAVSTPVYGRLADIYGRKRIFIVGATLFLVSSAACGFAWGMVPLIVMRTIQGLGAGAIQPVAWTVLGDTFAGRERGTVQGYLSTVFGVSALCGPLLGGFIVEHLHWALVFWINVPISIAAMLMLGMFLTETIVPKRQEIDYLGGVLLMLGVGTLMVALVQAHNLEGSTIMILCGAGGIALLALTFQERRAAEPIVPFKLWRLPIIVLGNLGSFVIGAVMMCNAAFLPTYLQGAMGASPAVAGLALGASSVMWTAGTFLAAKTMMWFSYRTTALLGGAIMVVGALLLLTLDPAQGPVWAAFSAAVLGFGMGISNTTFVISTQSCVGWDQRGAATSANLFLRTIGQSIGTALFGAVFNYGLAQHVAGADREINLLMQPATRGQLDGTEIARLSEAIGASMHNVYIIAGLMSVVMLLLAFKTPNGLALQAQPDPKAVG
jgi:EmrB/QacA subfamily drug resistance transporter